MRRWSRTVLSSVFVLFMLASGHLLMVAINALELRVARPGLEEGLEARFFSDSPLAHELESAIGRTRRPDHRAALEHTLSRVKGGESVTLRAMPVTRFLVMAALGLVALGLALVWLTSRLQSDAAQTIVGVFAGNLLWTGGVEYGLTIAARGLGVGKTVGVVNGQVMAVFGEYTLLKHSWGALALVMAYLLFLESSRCPLFLFFRERAPLMRNGLVSGRIDNYGPRTAFQYATTVWGFYLLLLWAYDERLFGVRGAFTTSVLALSIAGAVYTSWRLHQHTGWGPAIRYAIGAMVVAWTPLEVLGKWGAFREPWLLLEPATVLLFFGGLALGTWALWRAQRRPAPA
ncbi:MAG: hypothetical protein JNJ54_20950 [Myxococcaceae bacterium]|nr:hypothetical protein [Myxococcaceae bacterium]